MLINHKLMMNFYLISYSDSFFFTTNVQKFYSYLYCIYFETAEGHHLEECILVCCVPHSQPNKEYFLISNFLFFLYLNEAHCGTSKY